MPHIKIKKELLEEKDREKVELQLEVIKAKNQDQDIQKKLVLREDKCHFKEEFPSMDLQILTG